MISFWVLKRRDVDAAGTLAAINALLAGAGSVAPPAAGPAGVESTPIPPAGIPGVVPPGDIATRFGNPPADVADAIKRHWPQQLWRSAAELSYMESGWRNTAELNTLNRGPCGTRYWFSDAVGWATTEQSIGIFQINRCAHGGTVDQWRDPNENARKGYELYRSSGWSPWIVSARRLGLL